MSPKTNWKEAFAPPKPKAITYIYDLEVFDNLFLVGYRKVDDEEVKFFQLGLGVNELPEILKFFKSYKTWFVGYNNHYFDDTLMTFIFSMVKKWQGLVPESITTQIHKKSQLIIASDSRRRDAPPFKSFDLMRIGNIFKSLKMVGINLKWPKIQEIPFHIHHQVKPNELEEVLLYCANDVNSTMAMFEKLRAEINMRSATSAAYNVSVMNEADSGMANRLLNKLYAEKTGQPQYSFYKLGTERGTMALSDIIHPGISYKSKSMQKFLRELREKTVGFESTLKERVRIGDSVYDIAKGGLHSANPPVIVESSNEYVIIDADVESYYPRIMTNYLIKPEHLSMQFIDLLKEITERRLEAKASGDKVTADALKIIVNSIFGKLGYEYFWLYDLLAMYRVTINGQLMLLMLIDSLENAGIDVFYANTDGITARVRMDQRETYKEICATWQRRTKFKLEFNSFKKCVIRDVNNFLIIKTDGTVKMKGVLDINRWKDLRKGFDKPIIPWAIHEFFVQGTPVEETIRSHEDLLDFCLAQKPAKSFQVVFDAIDSELNQVVRTKLQQANRYYVSKTGGSIRKVAIKADKTGNHKEISMVAGETVVVLNDFDPKETYPEPRYQWYIKEATKIIRLFQSKQTDMFAKTQ